MLIGALLPFLLCLVVVPTSEQDTNTEAVANSAGSTAPGDDTEPAPGDDDTDPAPGDDTDPAPGDDTDPAPGDDTGPAPGDDTEPAPGDVTEPAPDDDTEPAPDDVTEPPPGEVTNPPPGDVTEPAPGDATEPPSGDITSTTMEIPSDSTTDMESTTAGGSADGSTVNPAHLAQSTSKTPIYFFSTFSAINRICPNNQLMNDRIRNNALRAHNYRRSRLAQGLVINKAGKTLPMASNMHRLAYNCSLEKSAMAAAYSCSSGNSLTLLSDMQRNAYAVLKNVAQYRKDAIVEVSGIYFLFQTSNKY
ncbi:hypothetical protein GCK32_017085 [Trichostrongylus colubriformis]|uniref:SCP domain-containing protein n=1 Tax=Trichostrongylus colubriformis TaxID=6319 RepID=A0AAN8EV05_TRICO